MQSPPQIRIYLFTHRNWRIVRNDPASPTHRYWAIRPRSCDHRGVEIQPSKQYGPFPLWSSARAFVDEMHTNYVSVTMRPYMYTEKEPTE